MHLFDGNRALVKKVAGGVTTVYVGNYYEKQGGAVTKYYFFGGQRVAMNKAGVVYWLAGDHLGSTALTVSSSGVKVAELRYKAWGETRYTYGTTPTSFRYTGQRQEEGLGIYQMGARWYDPALGRWLSADTIVPEPGEPQALNRYSYVYNRPLVAIDTSGHIAFLLTAALGALAGAGVSYAGQVIGNIAQNGLNVDAFTNVDPRAIATGAVVGLVAGATMGVGLTAFGAMGAAWGSGTVVTELIVTGSAGALSGWSAGRAEHLVNAGYAEYDRWKAGQSFEFCHIWDEAVANGLWDTKDMLIDTGTGTFFAWVGMGLASALEKAGVISLTDVSSTTTSKPSYVIGFRPDGNVVLETARGPIQLSMAQFEKFLITLQATGVEAAQEFLTQALEEAATD